LLRALFREGVSENINYIDTPEGAQVGQKILNIPKTTTLSCRLWGGVDFLRANGYQVVRS
jgi:hypothetical protein